MPSFSTSGSILNTQNYLGLERIHKLNMIVNFAYLYDSMHANSCNLLLVHFCQMSATSLQQYIFLFSIVGLQIGWAIQRLNYIAQNIFPRHIFNKIYCTNMCGTSSFLLSLIVRCLPTSLYAIVFSLGFAGEIQSCLEKMVSFFKTHSTEC